MKYAIILRKDKSDVKTHTVTGLFQDSVYLYSGGFGAVCTADNSVSD